jgi:hypothetical protein
MTCSINIAVQSISCAVKPMFKLSFFCFQLQIKHTYMCILKRADMSLILT